MSTKIIIFVLLFSSYSHACKLGLNSKWGLSEPELEKVTKNIVVAKLVQITTGKGSKLANLKFQVSEVKKGKLKKKETVYIRNVLKTESDSITYGKACNFEFNYKENQDYLIYIDTLNPNSIKPISSLEK